MQSRVIKRLYDNICHLKATFSSESIVNFLAGDSEFLLCFVCAVSTAIGLVISATFLIAEDPSLCLACSGLFISAISFGTFLYLVRKMD